MGQTEEYTRRVAGDGIEVHSVDGGESFVVRFSDETSPEHDEIEFEDFETARLLYGLWKSCGPFQIVIGDWEVIPTQVATCGREAVASYLGIVLKDSYYNIRDFTADALSVNSQTVSNYWNRTRWDGCVECGSENIRKGKLIVDQDEVLVADCYDCGGYSVIPEDVKKHEHEGTMGNCVEKLEPVVELHRNSGLKVWCCITCGFFTAEPERHQIKTSE